MATITERRDSRTGGAIGLHHTEAPTRRFDVRLASLAEDPVAELMAEVPPGSSHPWQSFLGFVASAHRVEEQIQPDFWVLAVDYTLFDTPAFVGGIFSGWRFSARTQTQDIETFVDRKGDFIRIPVYKPHREGGFKANDAEGRTVRLLQTEAFQQFGLERLNSLTQFTLSSTIQTFNLSKLMLLASSKNAVNLTPFLGPPGHVMLMDWSIDQSGGVFGQQETGTPAWDIALHFLWDTERPFDPVTRYHVWQDDSGNQSLIYPFTGAAVPVKSTFALSQVGDFVAFLGALQA